MPGSQQRFATDDESQPRSASRRRLIVIIIERRFHDIYRIYLSSLRGDALFPASLSATEYSVGEDEDDQRYEEMPHE